jgi:hypothetical protein
LISRDGSSFDASGVVPVDGARFVFINDRDPRALFELNLNPDGSQRGPVVRRPIVGLPAGALSDPEGIARIDVGGEIHLIVASSLSVSVVHPPAGVTAHDGLVRIRYTPAGALHAETMAGFRDWLIAGHPALAAAARRLPDDGGLNVEGLAWDPSRQALLFGLRSPADAGRIPVLCVHLDTGAPWSTAALHGGPQLSIEKSDFAEPQGVRDIGYDPARREFLVVVGPATSFGDVPFELCTWDGTSSAVNILDVTFDSTSMKPEGVTAVPGDDRKILIVDDASGFAVLARP